MRLGNHVESGAKYVCMVKNKKPGTKHPGAPKRNRRHPGAETPPDKEWIQMQIERTGMSQRTIAKMLNLTAPKFTRTLTGERTIMINEIIHLAGIIDIPLPMLLAKFGYPTAANTAKRGRIKK